MINPRVNKQEWPFWAHLLLVFLFFTYVWIRYSNRKKTTQYSNAFFTSRAIGQILREESLGVSRFSAVLSFFSLTVIGLFLFGVGKEYNSENILLYESTFLSLLAILGVIFVLYQVKALLIKILGITLKMNHLSQEYTFNMLLFNQFLAFFLFPIVIGMMLLDLVPTKFFLYLGTTIVLFVFLFRLYRSLPWSLANKTIAKYYLFLYLCTLEILPLILLVKVFGG